MMPYILGAFILLLVAHPGAAPAADPHASAGTAVFLDPAFGGTDPGPVLDGKVAGKGVTLDIAKETYRALRSQGVAVHLSRSRDVAVSADERLVKARKTGGDLYISIRVSRDSRNCVQVSVPSFPSLSPDDSPDAYLMNILWEKLQRQSGELAQVVSRALKSRSVALCGEVIVRNDRALERARLPVIIVDWRTGGAAAAGQAPIDTQLQRKLSSALAEGIREYGAASAGDDQRHQ